MDPRSRGLREYAGNYSAYLEQRQAEIEKQWADYKDQQMEIRRMQQDIARVKAQAAYTERQASSIRIGGPDMKIKGFKSTSRASPRRWPKRPNRGRRSWSTTWNRTSGWKDRSASWQIKLEFSEAGAPEPLGHSAGGAERWL